MASNWRLNVELTGNSDFQWIFWNPLNILYLNFNMMAELNTPFTFLGHTYTHIVLATGLGSGRLWNYIGLLPDGRWYSAFTWSVAPKGWPYGADVVPD